MESTIKVNKGPDLSKRLRLARQNQSLTLASAAAKIGCHRSYLSKLENGIARRPSANFLRTAAAVFQVNQHWLEAGVGEPRMHIGDEGNDLEQDAEFLSAITIAFQQMTIVQLVRWASAISDQTAISSARKGVWLRLIAPWIAMKSRSEEQLRFAAEFELAQTVDIHNKWTLMADSTLSHWENLRRQILVRTQERGARAQLARLLKVTPQVLNEWLQGRNAPPAEQTLRLLRWVEQGGGESQQKNRAVRSAKRPAPKTRKGKNKLNEKSESDQDKP